MDSSFRILKEAKTFVSYVLVLVLLSPKEIYGCDIVCLSPRSYSTTTLFRRESPLLHHYSREESHFTRSIVDLHPGVRPRKGGTSGYPSGRMDGYLEGRSKGVVLFIVIHVVVCVYVSVGHT